jgi:hypothetical protein
MPIISSTNLNEGGYVISTVNNAPAITLPGNMCQYRLSISYTITAGAVTLTRNGDPLHQLEISDSSDFISTTPLMSGDVISFTSNGGDGFYEMAIYPYCPSNSGFAFLRGTMGIVGPGVTFGIGSAGGGNFTVMNTPPTSSIVIPTTFGNYNLVINYTNSAMGSLTLTDNTGVVVSLNQIGNNIVARNIKLIPGGTPQNMVTFSNNGAVGTFNGAIYPSC